VAVISLGELVVTTEDALGTEVKDMVYVEQRTLILVGQIGLADWRESRHVSNGENANGIDGASIVIVEILLLIVKEEAGIGKGNEVEIGKGATDGVEIGRETTSGGMDLYNS